MNGCKWLGSSWSSLFLKIFACQGLAELQCPDRLGFQQKVWFHLKSLECFVYCFVIYIHRIPVGHHFVLGTGVGHAFRFLQYLYCSRDTIVLLFLFLSSSTDLIRWYVIFGQYIWQLCVGGRWSCRTYHMRLWYIVLMGLKCSWIHKF